MQVLSKIVSPFMLQLKKIQFVAMRVFHLGEFIPLLPPSYYRRHSG